MKKNQNKKLGIIGLGHVGLPTALGFAELGFEVFGTDQKHVLDSIESKNIPFYEPGLDELLIKHLNNNFKLVENISELMKKSIILFICVGTPEGEYGKSDLSAIEKVAKEIGNNLTNYKLIVEKSTVPVTTGDWIKKIIIENSKKDVAFDVASNPEFLREGTALYDLLNPDRIVLGVETDKAKNLLTEIYKSFDCPIFTTDMKTVEITKHASNAFLAMRVSFINMISDICERTGGDVTKVATAMGLDPRIGQSYLHAGIGYGGYCLPKDIRSLINIGNELNLDLHLLKSVELINNQRINLIVEKIKLSLNNDIDNKIGILGLSFKPNTDDIRESPSIKIVETLLNENFQLYLHDPQAMIEVKKYFENKNNLNLNYCESAYETAINSNIVVVLTPWNEYKDLDWEKIAISMKNPTLLDAMNLMDPKYMQNIGLNYISVGR